jgi:hypothetical protein
MNMDKKREEKGKQTVLSRSVFINVSFTLRNKGHNFSHFASNDYLNFVYQDSNHVENIKTFDHDH